MKKIRLMTPFGIDMNDTEWCNTPIAATNREHPRPSAKGAEVAAKGLSPGAPGCKPISPVRVEPKSKNDQRHGCAATGPAKAQTRALSMRVLRFDQQESSMDTNNGFWDRPADERADRMRDAAERGGVENFFDLPPEERAQAYEKD